MTRTRVGSGAVVVEVDGSAEGLRVLDYACTEAIRGGAELVLVASRPVHDPHLAADSARQPWPPAERTGEFLRIAVAHVRRQVGRALKPSVVCEEGTRVEVLSEAARDARLLVVRRPRHRGSERLLIAKGNLLLARRSSCPVVVVPGSWKLAPAVRDVAVGIDGTSLSSAAVEYAFWAAADRGGNLVAVHAAPRHSSPSGARARRAEFDAAVLDRSTDYPQVQVTRYLTGRPVVAALVHKAQEVGLLVVGAHAGTPSADDPVARRVLAVADCPVAIVRRLR